MVTKRIATDRYGGGVVSDIGGGQRQIDRYNNKGHTSDQKMKDTCENNNNMVAVRNAIKVTLDRGEQLL